MQLFESSAEIVLRTSSLAAPRRALFCLNIGQIPLLPALLQTGGTVEGHWSGWDVPWRRVHAMPWLPVSRNISIHCFSWLWGCCVSFLPKMSLAVLVAFSNILAGRIFAANNYCRGGMKLKNEL